MLGEVETKALVDPIVGDTNDAESMQPAKESALARPVRDRHSQENDGEAWARNEREGQDQAAHKERVAEDISNDPSAQGAGRGCLDLAAIHWNRS